MNEHERNYYNYINNVNNSIQTMLDIYRLQHQTILNNTYNHGRVIHPHYYTQYYTPVNNANNENNNTNMNYVNNNYHGENNNYLDHHDNNSNNDVNDNTDDNDNNDNNNDNNNQDNEDNIFEREFQEFVDNLINENLTEELFCNIDNPINRECPITQETFRNYDRVGVINHCKHIFNYDAIKRWLGENYVCPMCRHDIRGIQNSEPQDNLTVNDIVERISEFLQNANSSEGRNRRLVIRYHMPRNNTSN